MLYVALDSIVDTLRFYKLVLYLYLHLLLHNHILQTLNLLYILQVYYIKYFYFKITTTFSIFLLQATRCWFTHNRVAPGQTRHLGDV